MPRQKRPVDSHPELGLPEVRKLWQTEGLFSDHYLKARIRSNSWWPADEETRPIWEFCKALYEKRYVTCARNNEAFTRQELIDKILHEIGFAWTDNLRLPESQQDLEPDYILFGSESEKESVIDEDAAQRYRAAISLLEAKKVNHPLSQISRRQLRYPHQQVRDYLNEAQVVNWGILTNGNEWRLYCRDAKPSRFFAIDFAESIKSLDNFKFFLALFNPAAFARDAHAKCRLDYVRETALATQSELEEDLRQRVFTLVEILANGFVERSENEIADTDLAHVYDASLIFLYRLLFILYAEGRQLLPVEPKSRKYYKQLSLARLVTPLKNFSEYDSRTRTRLYEDVRELCQLINGTDQKKNTEFSVPRYNGGLFDPSRHSFLEKWRVSDAVLSEVLRGLMFNPQPNRDEPTLPTETVDFGDLRVQQLGSIYEGLMEHHFHRDGNTLKLVADKAERRETGTYYTPDYIVKYIVEQTIGPLLAEIERCEGVKKARAAGSKDNSFAREALKLNILDPAMGSGHFLVNATTYLAEEIAAHPTTKSLGEKSRDEDEIAHWRRRVVESCIYGVDLNPLAVELAKLSLWLTTIAADQPLDFLDHHLCCGNSLIGARLEDLGHVPELKKKKEGFKFTWKLTDNLRTALRKAVQTVRQIEDRVSKSIDDVKTKERIWLDSIRPALRPFRSVANLWTACFFGNDLGQADYEALLELLDIDPENIRPWKTGEEFQEIVLAAVAQGTRKLAGREFDKNQLKNLCAFLIRADNTARQRRFFDWELEFPEVFFEDDGSLRESAGFDAVIGNPPYVDIKGLKPEIVDYIFKVFPSARLRVNIFATFIEQEVGLSRSGEGHIGAIIPTAFLTQLSYSTLRKLILVNGWLKKVVRLPNELFGAAAGEVKVDTCIVVIQKTSDVLSPTECLIYNGFQRVDKISRETASSAFDIRQEKWTARPDAEITITSSNEDKILERMRGNSVRLDELCEFCLGLTPYDKYAGQTKEQIENKVFHAKSKLDSTFKKLLLSGDVSRYNVEWNGEDWIKYGDWLAAPREQRFFTSERILVQQIVDWSSLRILAGWTNEELYNTQNQFNLLARSGANLKFVAAVLNSKLISYYHRRVFLDVALQRFQKILIKDAKTFPFPRIDFTTPANRATQLSKAKESYEKSLAAKDAKDALHVVEACLKAERTDVVHDLLALLAERMIAMNRQKRMIAKQFLTDLRDFHGIDAHALNPKTKLDEFWKLEAIDLFAHLNKNVRRLEEQKASLGKEDQDKIRSRFVTAKESLMPLEAQIEFTDQLSDQIVYRLYDLTAEEIELVEGVLENP